MVKADIDFYRDRIHVIKDTYPDLSHRFFDREAARHNLEDRNHQTRQDHFDLTQLGGTQGCWQVYLHNKGEEVLLGKTYEEEIEIIRDTEKYVRRGYQASRWAVDFFGASISISLENQIRDLLVNNIEHNFVKNDPIFAQWLDMWDCIDVSVNNGSVYVKVGSDAQRRHRSSDGSLMYEAEETVQFRNYVDSDSNSYIRIIVPVGFKGVLTMVGDNGREIIDNNVSETYDFTNTVWREFVAKMTGDDIHAELVISREES